MCTGCGLCEALCPVDAVKMNLSNRGLYEPVIDTARCTECTYCLRICGRYELEYETLRRATFGEGPSHPLIGRYISIYRGHATDYALRWKATSGGAISALLKLGLQIGMIDAAVVTGPDPADPTMTRPFVADSFEGVWRASGARYAPSPIHRCLPEAMKSDRIAIVGLPCHFESLRKAEAIHKEVEKRVALHLGCFCSHNVSLLATEFIYRHFRVPKTRILSLSYRGGGWPGAVRIETVDGQEFRVPNQESFWTDMFMAYLFAAPYCLLCADHTSEFADIAFGDAWLPEVMETDAVGESVIISRTSVGERLLAEAVRRGVLEISGLPPDRIVASQCWPLYFKKRLIHGARQLLSEKRFDVDDGGHLPGETDTDRWLVRRAWFNSVHSCHPFVPDLLSRLPLRLIQAYSKAFSSKLWGEACKWLQSYD